MYDIFLCFSDFDLEEARQIWQEVRSKGLKVFFSHENLDDGDPWVQEINKAIEKSRHFILLSTPNSMSSHWVQIEYTAFFNSCFVPNQRERKFFILKGKDFAAESVPILLKSNIQFSANLDQILRSLNEEIDEKKEELAKIKEEKNIRSQIKKEELTKFKEDKNIRSQIKKVSEVQIKKESPKVDKKWQRALAVTSTLDSDKTSLAWKKYRLILFPLLAGLMVMAVLLFNKYNESPEEIAFKDIISNPTLSDIDSFLAKWPHSEYSDAVYETRYSVENTVANDLLKQDQLDGFREFLINNPNSDFKDTIESRIAILTCEVPVARRVYDHYLRQIRFANDGLYAASYDGKFIRYSLIDDSLHVRNAIDVSTVNLRAMDFIENYLVCTDVRRKLYRIDLKTKKLIGAPVKKRGDVNAVFFVDASNYISCDRYGLISFSNVNTSSTRSYPAKGGVFDASISSSKAELALIYDAPGAYPFIKKIGFFQTKDKRVDTYDLPQEASSVEFFPTENKVAIGGLKKILVWDREKNAVSKTLEGHNNYVRDICFTSDGNCMISGGDDQKVIIWDVSTASKIKTLQFNAEIMSLDYQDDKMLLAVTTKDHAVTVYNISHYTRGLDY
ncbi:MAG: TIR domain-containing protein [Bacteroidota bacterium]